MDSNKQFKKKDIHQYYCDNCGYVVLWDKQPPGCHACDTTGSMVLDDDTPLPLLLARYGGYHGHIHTSIGK